MLAAEVRQWDRYVQSWGSIIVRSESERHFVQESTEVLVSEARVGAVTLAVALDWVADIYTSLDYARL